MKASLVDIAGRRLTGNEHGGIAFNEAWQLGSLSPHVSDLQEKVVAERSLDAQIPILRVGQRQAWRKCEVRHRGYELPVAWRAALKWIGKIRQIHLRRLQVWWRADRRLEGAALPRVIRFIEHAVPGADEPIRIPGRIPGQTDARGEGLLLRGNQASRHPSISRIE